jgi:hypothetical protein
MAYRQHHTTEIGGDDSSISAVEAKRALADAFKTAADDAAKATGGKPIKLFGLFEVDAELGAYVNGIYNMATRWADANVLPRLYGTVEKLGTKHLKWDSSTASKVAAVAVFGSNVVLRSGKYIGDALQVMGDQRKEYMELAKKMAPVLDELKGGHSVLSLMRVGRFNGEPGTNDMAYYEAWRLGKKAGMQNFNSLIDIGVNSGPSLLMDSRKFGRMWEKGVSPSKLAEIDRASHDASASNEGDMSFGAIGGLAMDNTLPQVAKIFKKKNEEKLAKLIQGYSGFDLVCALQEQVTNKADAKTFSPPGNNSRPLSLENYISMVIIQHQKDMVAIDPEQSLIRDELHEDLALVAKPMAKALRDGTISAMSLVRLIGENHVIKSHGRVIASAAEVEAQIERMAGKATSRAHHDPKDYYGTASFTKDDLKGALKSLDGDERLMFASWFPDAVLEDAGVPASEIKSIREATKASYEKGLLEVLSGLGTLSDQELKEQTGLAAAEIKQLRDMLHRIEQKGSKAVHDLRVTPANPHGVEHLLSNALVNGAKEHLGTIIASGREALAETEHSAEAHDAEQADHATPPGYHRKGFKSHGGHVDRHSRGSHHEHLALPS